MCDSQFFNFNQVFLCVTLMSAEIKTEQRMFSKSQDFTPVGIKFSLYIGICT